MKAKKPSRILAMAAASSLLPASGQAYATEGGGSIYPHGSDRLNDGDGKNLQVPGFKVTANAVTRT